MKKKLLKNSGVEDRLLGVEQRLTRLEDESSKIRWQMVGLDNDFHQLGKSFVKMEDRFMKEFEEFRSRLVTLIDPLFGQLKKFNEEQSVHAGQHQEVYEKIEKLEKIHPDYSHVAI